MDIALWILTAFYYIIIIAIVIKILLENRKPIYSTALIALLIVFPIIGLILFFFLAYKMNKSTFVSKKWHNERKEIQEWKKDMYEKIEDKISNTRTKLKEWNKIINMLYLFDKASPTYNNNIEILINGENFFYKLKKDLLNAKKHIHLEFYVFDNDIIGNEIINILINKAKEGVKIKCIIDSFGARAINKKLFKLLRANNIETYSFLPLFTPKLFRFVNIRDHRKLVVIDGKTAYTGGINVADRYINTPKAKHRYWRDTGVRITGDSVKSFQLQFFNIWKFVSKQQNDFVDEIFTEEDNNINNNCVIQLADSGPDSEYQSIFNSLFIAITNAQKDILIQTPYFAPPEELYMAIQNAALSGINVKIIIPEFSDNAIVTNATRSYIDSLLNVGVEFYMYQKGFIHSKVIIIDDLLSSIGSTNFDFRSFFSNYELNVMIFNSKINKEFKQMFFDDLNDCKKLNYQDWKKRHLTTKIKESICRLFAPIL